MRARRSARAFARTCSGAPYYCHALTVHALTVEEIPAVLERLDDELGSLRDSLDPDPGRGPASDEG